MKILYTKRGVLAVSESQAELDKIAEAWPLEETWSKDWAGNDRKNSTRRGGR